MTTHRLSTLGAIALSSTEAELYAASVSLSETTGYKSLGHDCGEDVRIATIGHRIR